MLFHLLAATGVALGSTDEAALLQLKASKKSIAGSASTWMAKFAQSPAETAESFRALPHEEQRKLAAKVDHTEVQRLLEDRAHALTPQKQRLELLMRSETTWDWFDSTMMAKEEEEEEEKCVRAACSAPRWSGLSQLGGEDDRSVQDRCSHQRDGNVPVCSIRKRVELSEMDQGQFERFAEAVNKLHFDGTWEKIYTLHHASGPHAHSTDHFLHWHRRFLHDVETLIQDAAHQLHPDQDHCEVTLPYWNWAEDYNIDHNCPDRSRSGDDHIFTCERYGALHDGYHVVRDGMFGWGTFNREPNSIKRVSPGTYAQVQNDVEDATHLDFTNFRWTLENYFHNSPHCNVGGTMCSYDSPQDPLFFAHHTFIDRLWYTWQQNKAEIEGDSTEWKTSPAGPLEHLLCPAESDESSAWVDSANLQGVEVSYATRAEMIRNSNLQVQESGNSPLRMARYWKETSNGIMDCCQAGLAKAHIKAAKAIIMGRSGQDLCAVNLDNVEYKSDKAWCSMQQNYSSSVEDCEKKADMAVKGKEKEETGLPHCVVSHPVADERKSCMALYSNEACKENMFDLCLQKGIKHANGQSLCIAPEHKLLVDKFRQDHLGMAGIQYLPDSTIEEVLKANREKF